MQKKVTEEATKKITDYLGGMIFENKFDYGAIFYDAQIGRWPTKDPEGEKTVSESLYGYVKNDPILMIDKYGKYAVTVHY